MGQIQEKLNLLKIARKDMDSLKKDLKVMEDQFKYENQSLINSVAISKEDVEKLEFEIRELAVAEYNETKNKELEGGVKIKLGKAYEYKEEDAFAWAKEHKMALKLDDKAFKTLVKVSPENFTFVTVKKDVPSATIPSEIK